MLEFCHVAASVNGIQGPKELQSLQFSFFWIRDMQSAVCKSAKCLFDFAGCACTMGIGQFLTICGNYVSALPDLLLSCRLSCRSFLSLSMHTYLNLHHAV